MAYSNLGGVFSKPIVATRGRFGELGRLSDGVVTTQNNRLAVSFPYAVTNIELVYGNFGGTDLPGLNDIRVRAAFEQTDGSLTVLSPGGSRDITIPPSEYGSIPVPGVGTLAANTLYYIRQRVNVDAGGKFICSMYCVNFDEGVENGTDDSVDKTIITGNLSLSYAAPQFGPICIIGTTVDGRKVAVAICGDSNAAGGAGGFYETTVAGARSNSEGFAGIAIGGVYPTCNIAQNGEAAADTTFSPYREAILDACSHALVLYGTNNVFLMSQSLATAKANVTLVWEKLRSRGLIVKQCTIPPQTTSSDGWATAENQTLKAQESVRASFNDWIRAGADGGHDGYFDIADQLETSRNSGFWIPLMTADGVHMNYNEASGQIAAASAIDPAEFVLPAPSGNALTPWFIRRSGNPLTPGLI